MPLRHASMKQCAWKLCRWQAMGKMGRIFVVYKQPLEFLKMEQLCNFEFQVWFYTKSMSSKTLCYLCPCSIELLRSWPFLHLYSRKRWVASLFMAIPIDHNKIIIWLVVQVCPFDKTGDSLEIMKNPYNKYETNENSIHIEAMLFLLLWYKKVIRKPFPAESAEFAPVGGSSLWCKGCRS